MDRTTIIRGPAIIKLGATELYSADDITVAAEIATTEGKTSVHGKYGEFMDTVVHTISFNPAPQATAAYFAALFPYGAAVLGASVFGAMPPDLVVHSVDGKTYTYKAAALTQMPGLTLAANAPIFDGEAVFTALGDCTEAWSATDHFVASAEAAFASTSFDASADLRKHYPANWGAAAPWTGLETEGGIKVAFAVELEDVMSDSYGIVDKTVTGVSATATFTPQGITPEDVIEALGIQGSGAARGRPMGGAARDLVIGEAVVGEPIVTLSNAIFKGSSTQFGAAANRVGELTLTTLRQLSGGSLTPAFTVALHTV